jgi:hypothetical protein
MFKIHFDMSNEAFDDFNGATECGRILRDLAERIEESGWFDYLPIRDINGNTIGELTMSAPVWEDE